jgi:hypothetical protein
MVGQSKDCLNTKRSQKKITTKLQTDNMPTNNMETHVWYPEQKGIRPGSIEPIDQLLNDKKFAKESS